MSQQIQTSSTPHENRALSDSELYLLCKKYGLQALEARRKFAGLLPEVNDRDQKSRALSSGKSWLEKRGYTCVYEFAARLAGMSREQVNLVLRLERKFAAMPMLRGALVNGEISANKLARVASLATPENEKELAETAKILSKKALEVLIKDLKIDGKTDNTFDSTETSLNCQQGLFSKGAESQYLGGDEEFSDGLQIRKNDETGVPGHSKNQQTTPEVNLIDHLSAELQKDLIVRLKKGIDINSLLLELLKKHDQYIEKEKARIATEMEHANGGGGDEGHANGNPAHVNKQKSAGLLTSVNTAKTSPHVPARVSRVIKLEYGTKCAIPHCDKKATTLHHTTRFALTKTHNPFYIAPLCAEHHSLAHLMDANYARMRGG